MSEPKFEEIIKRRPLSYEEVMRAVQLEALDCDRHTILEVGCMSRGLDLGALTYLFGVLHREDGSRKCNIVCVDSKANRPQTKGRIISTQLPEDLRRVAKLEQ